MSQHTTQFSISTQSQNPAWRRSVLKERYEVGLEWDRRLPTEHGGARSTQPGRSTPRVAVCSWLLARLAKLVGPELSNALVALEDEATVHLEVTTDGDARGLVTLVVESSGQIRLLCRADTAVAANELEGVFRESLLEAPGELLTVDLVFANGVRFGWRDGQYLAQEVAPFDAAVLVEQVLNGAPVQRGSEDRSSSCPLSLEDIARRLSSSRRELRPDEVEYLRSMKSEGAEAWVFKARDSGLHAVVLQRRGLKPKTEIVG